MKRLLLLFVLVTLFTSNTQAQCWKDLQDGVAIVGIKEDNTLWGWGGNYNGIFGDSSGTLLYPIQIGIDNDWSAISVGLFHVLALKSDGTLWQWGRIFPSSNPDPNSQGTIVNTPVQIGSDNDWLSISAGWKFSAAIKSDGTLWMWGYNEFGQLGNGTNISTVVPTKVGNDSNWEAVSASYTVAGIKTSGTLWEWGDNMYTEAIEANYPVQKGIDTDWKLVSTGGFATSAVKNNGTLWSWGFNLVYGLGNGNNISTLTPVQIGTDHWISVKRGLNYNAGGIKEDNSLWTWGSNDRGQLGNGNTVDQPIPTLVLSDIGWESYFSGSFASIGIKTDGKLFIWGDNYADILGINPWEMIVTLPTEFNNCSPTPPVANLNDNTLAQIKLYPNPTSSALTLANAGNLSIENLSVTDMTGKLVLSQKGNNSEINVEVLPAGIYFLNVSAQEGVQHLKFVKE